MSVPRWGHAALGFGACAGFALTAGCASRPAPPDASNAPAPRDSTIASDYGAQPQRGAMRANRLTRADIEAAGTTDIATIIETRLTGVRVIRRGGDYIVEIHGGPALVLIDGVQGTIGSVPVHDIQTMEVLKDAAAAIYGRRGASGVLLITTRRPQRYTSLARVLQQFAR